MAGKCNQFLRHCLFTFFAFLLNDMLSPKNGFIVHEVLDLQDIELLWQGLGAVLEKGTRAGSDTECRFTESLLEVLNIVK